MEYRGQRKEQGSGMQDGVAKGLGWFSIGLGLTEIFASKALARLIGVRPQPWLLPALGLRELTSGFGILSTREPTGWLWSRVAGDIMDLGLLGSAYLADECEDEGRMEAAAAAVAGVTVLDVFAALQHSRNETHSVRTRRAITINRSPEELYQFWHRFENLPRIMHNLDAVRSYGNRSHWVAQGPGGKRVEWDAEITDDRPDEFIAWRSLPGADVDNTGWVSFERAPGNRGTIVRVELEYSPPGGVLGAMVAKLLGKAPEQEIQADLYRLKQILETGQITTVEGQPAGRSSSTSTLYDHGTTRG